MHYAMSYLHSFRTHFAAILLLSTWRVGLSALLLHQAGNASFTTLEQSSFWLSDRGNYTFGFQAINGGEDYLLSIWHSLDPNKTAIWWAVASAPLKAGASLRFASSGSLELYSAPPGAALLWSSNTSSSYATLQDIGNLLLFASNKVDISWQSFDDSRDSLMLAGVDDFRVSNKPYLLQSRENPLSYAAGRFHLATTGDLDVHLHGLDAMGNDFVYLYAHMNTSGGFQIGQNFGNDFTSNSLNEIKRLTMDYDGNLRVYMWESIVSSWREEWQILGNKCMLGSPCGPFGICKETAGNVNGINCSCPPGYHPRTHDDILQGCQASISFNASCGTGHANNYSATIVEVPYSDYNYNDLKSIPHLSIDVCKVLCLNECACMAASYRGDNTCFLKGNSSTGYLLSGYSTGGNTLLMKVVVMNISSEAIPRKQSRQWVIGVGVAVVLAVLIVAGLSAWLLRRRRRGKGTSSYLSCWARRQRHEYEAAREVGPMRFYRYEELLHATRNFSEKLGEGGFGIVYKGWVKVSQKSSIRHVEQPAKAHNNTSEFAVAVKVLKTKEHGDSDGAELRTLGKIHHVNLVSLLGYCTKRGRAGEEKLLVYEYMENGSLDRFLSMESHERLAWGMRYSIALGAARGIAYLHHECSPPILHCDIKPHNILLDANFTPKVADFGFARSFHVDSHIIMSGIRGTRGYLAPEWLSTQEHLTSKVDVFSFGMLLMELVRGFKPVDDRNMPVVDWAIQCITRGVVCVQELDENNPRPMDDEQCSIVEQEAEEKLRVLKVGMWCIQHNPSMRPPMSRVIQLIDGTLAVKDPPIPRSMFNVILPTSSISSGLSQSHLSSSGSTGCNTSYSVISAR